MTMISIPVVPVRPPAAIRDHAAAAAAAAAAACLQRIEAIWERCRERDEENFADELEIARELLEAKRTLPPDVYKSMVQEKLPFTKRHCNRILKVARHPILGTPESHIWPPYMTTRAVFTQLDHAIADCPWQTTDKPGNDARGSNPTRRNAELERIRNGARRHTLQPESVIGIADCPWQTTDNPTGYVRQVESHYPTLDVEALKSFRVDDGRHVSKIFAQDAILFFWTIDRALLDGSATAILAAWGFDYREIMVWRKPRMGKGVIVRNQHELVIVATRGHFATPATLGHSSVFEGEPWSNRHSAKPDRLYEIIEAMYPNIGPRVELFARQYREGWDGQGFEFPGHPEAVAMLEAAE